MIEAYAAEAVRAAESAALDGLPDGALMRRASTGLGVACSRALDHVSGALVVVLAGSGDNGGDAVLAGAWLARRGAAVRVVLLGSRVHEPALSALRNAGGTVISTESAASIMEGTALVLDGITGIGGVGGLRPGDAALVARAEASPALLVAVDLPSGVDADTGEVAGRAVHADLTVTFGAAKPGLLLDPGARHAGILTLVDIGLRPHLGRADVEVLDAGDVAALLPVPGADSDKYSRGVVGVVAGSDAFPGAAVLCVGGAVRSGAGMVRYSGPDHAASLVQQRWPEVVVGDGRVQAWALGSGLGEGGDAGRRARRALASHLPAVVDADGLTHLEPGRMAPTLLTPHAGELARMLGVEREAVQARRLEHARLAAERWGATVLLKGSTTVVATPDGRVRVNPDGPAWLATAGTGDVLAGVCGTLLAAGLDPLDAGSAGAWLHARAARLAAQGAPVSAAQVMEALPLAWRSATPTAPAGQRGCRRGGGMPG